MKLGLKVYVTNTEYISPAISLYEVGVYDFIEVYLVSGRSKEGISRWISTGIPLAFHAPHSYGGFNPSIEERAAENQTIMREVAEICSIYKPRYVVFHPGIQGKLEETIRQFDTIFKIYPQLRDFAHIENKPFLGMHGEQCLGSTPEEIKRVCESDGMGFCLDFSHAICAAVSLKLNWRAHIERFMDISPKVFHLSDGHVASENDEHLHIGAGNYDIEWCLNRIGENSCVAIETKKNKIDSLDDFLADVNSVRHLIKKGV